MSGRRGAGATPAVTALLAGGTPHVLHRYDAAARERSGYGDKVAAALGLDPAVVHKTLVADVGGGRLAAAVVPVASQLDLKALAGVVGTRRAAMADRAAAERSTGYVVGGISPLGQRTSLTTVVDDGALAHPTIYVSGGRRGLEIEIAPGDLVRLTGATVAPIAG